MTSSESSNDPSPALVRAFATDVVQRLRSAGFQALFAGGCVRDQLMGRTPKDYDVATNAVPDQVRDLFGRKKTLAVGAAFGVVIVLGPRGAGQVEVATFRSDGAYLDGRRPERVTFSTAEDDALRRDFTVNGMFYDPLADELIDYVGGRNDLTARVVRAIRDPSERMREDKLRMLRAVRFAASLEFTLDRATGDAIRQLAAQLSVVSAERIAQELRRMLADRHRRRAIDLADETQLTPHIIPELDSAESEPGRTTRAMLGVLETDRFETAAAVLLRTRTVEDVAHVMQRLKCSNEELRAVRSLVAGQAAWDGMPSWRLHQWKRWLAAPDLAEQLAMRRAAEAIDTALPRRLPLAEHRAADIPPDDRNPPPFATGDDLIAMGVKPNPRFKEWLDIVRDAQLDGELRDRDQALAWLRELATSGAK